MSIFVLALLLALSACGSETTSLGELNNNNLNPNPGTAGLASGTLTDREGGAIGAATVWTLVGATNARILTPDYIAHTAFDTCHEPTTAHDDIAHGGCSDAAGHYEIDCSGSGPVTIHLLNAHGEDLPSVQGNCGGAPVNHALDVEAQPTPCPVDSHDAGCPPHDHVD